MKTSFIKILKSDLLAVVSIIAPFMVGLLLLDAKYFGFLNMFFSGGTSDGNEDPKIYFWMFVICLIIFVPLLISRVTRIENIFKNGVEVNGVITFINLFKDRGQIKYSFELGGETYEKSHFVHRNKFINSLQHGQEVKIMVLNDNPKRALIKEMYIKK